MSCDLVCARHEGLEATIFANRSFKAILPDYRRPPMLCIALRPHQKLGMILVNKVVQKSDLNKKKISVNFFLEKFG